jgi:hypothetical protein
MRAANDGRGGGEGQEGERGRRTPRSVGGRSGRRETGAAKWRRSRAEESVRDCTGMETRFGEGWREKEETKKERKNVRRAAVGRRKLRYEICLISLILDISFD